MHSSSALPLFFFYLSSRKISKSTEGWIINSGPSEPWAGMFMSPCHCCFCAGFIPLLVFVWHLLQGVPAPLQLPGTAASTTVMVRGAAWEEDPRMSRTEEVLSAFPSGVLGRQYYRLYCSIPLVALPAASDTWGWFVGLVCHHGHSLVSDWDLQWGMRCPESQWILNTFKLLWKPQFSITWWFPNFCQPFFNWCVNLQLACINYHVHTKELTYFIVIWF